MTDRPYCPPSLLACCRNSRDLGGIRTAEGRRIRPFRLIRSGELSSMTAADELLLRQNRIGTVVDLRSDEERQKKPDHIPDGISLLCCPVINELIPGITRESIEDPYQAFARKSYSSELGSNGREIMRSLYPILVEQESALRHYREFFRCLLESGIRGVLWHCTMGKDRAGIAAALVLYALGVPYETILQDYLYTGICCADEIRDMTNACREFTDDPVILKSVYWLNTTDESYLNAAFHTMEQMCGSADGYLKDVMGIGNTERRELESSCLLS